jgi:hypothetical protein
MLIQGKLVPLHNFLSSGPRKTGTPSPGIRKPNVLPKPNFRKPSTNFAGCFLYALSMTCEMPVLLLTSSARPKVIRP